MIDILVVDDEVGLLKALHAILIKEGYNVAIAEDALKAQQLLNSRPFDIVLTDIYMPRISGVELLQSINNLFPAIKVILITGNPAVDTAREAIRANAFDYISKPVSKAELCLTIKRAAQVKRLEDENRKYKENLELLVQEQTREIRENERKYRLLAENASDVIWTLSPDLKPGYISPSVKKLLGYEPDELSDAFLRRILPPEGYNHVLKFLRHEFSFKTPSDDEKGPGYSRILEFEHIHKTGSMLWAEIRVNYLLDGTGRPVGILGITRDISERKKIELELIESEANFRNLAENAIDAIIIALEEGRQVYANRQATRITGYRIDQILSYTMKELLAPEEYMKIVNLYKPRAYTESSHNRCESVILRADGRKLPVEFSSTKTIWHGMPADLIFLRDISERRGWEDNIRRERDRIKQYLNIIDVMLIAINARQEVTLINRKGREILGYSEEEILGKNWFTHFLVKEEYGYALNIFHKFLAGELEPFYINENKIHTKRGEIRIITWRNVALHDDHGNITGMLSSGEDITHKLAMEVELRSSERRLNAIINSIADGIIVTDLKGNALFVNPAAEALLGKQSVDIIGNPLGFYLESDEVSDIEIIQKNNSPSIIAQLNVVDIEWAGKSAYLVILRDITEQKKARNNILQLSQFQMSVINNANVWLYVLDKQSAILIWNKAAEKISGYSEAEVVGNCQIWEWLYPDPQYREEVFNKITTSLEGNNIIEDFETVVKTRNNDVKTILWYIRNMFNNSGDSIGCLAMGRDISMQKDTEEKLRKSFKKLQRALSGVIKAIIFILETKDPYTSGHQKRVAEIAKAIALEMELPTDTVEAIYIAGSMHDIGKISVPVEILSKPGKLTEPEFLIIKEHVKIGYDILKSIEFPWPVADIVYQHHEACNGSGYPRGLKENEICIEAKILAVADVIEAISSDRPYRPALGIDTAMQEISKLKGIAYAVPVVEATLNLYYQKKFHFGMLSK